MKDLYKALVEADPISPRGISTRELLNLSLEFGYGQERIFHPLFNDNTNYLRKELEWYSRGDFKDISIVQHAKVWKGHVTDGVLFSNYGAWLWNHSRSGLIRAVNMIRTDRNTRRAICYIGDTDLVQETNRDVPCTMGLQFIIRNDQLYTRVWMRSQDAYLGLRNDLVAFWFFAKLFAKLTNSKPFMLRIDVGSFHLYEHNVPLIQAVVDSSEDVDILPYDYSNLVEDLATKLSRWL